MKYILIVLLGLLSAACTVAPARQLAASDPADPGAAVPPTHHRSVFETYVSQRPVDPAPWRKQNESVAPKPKQ